MTGVNQLNARVLGSGARTVVFGHGFGTDQTSWHDQVAAVVASGRRAVVFDFAGATEQTLPAYQAQRHSSLYGFAEDLALLMQALQIKGATYVGHSLGGMIGALVCNGAPGVFDSLVMLASSARYLDEPASGYVGGFSQNDIDQLLASMQNDYATWANGFAPLIVGQPERPVFAQEFTRGLLRLRPDVACAVLRAAFLSDHRRDVARLSVPLQVLHSVQDIAVPLPAAQWLATHGRALDFTVIPTRGHFPQLTAPAEVNGALFRFLDAHARH